jgi:pimeloyl-ACP methyl ester carboxylesterase
MMLQSCLTIAAILAGALASSSAWAAADGADRPFRIAKQGSFFVGGRDVQSDALSTISNFASSGTISVDQVYVRYQSPVRPENYSITLIHGCCLSGKSWETTPDGRMGWDEYFLRQNFTVYVIDQAWRGRSAANPTAVNVVKVGKAAADTLPAFISAGHESAWTIFRFGPEYPKVFPGMQFPLEAQREFWKQMVPDWGYSMKPPVPTVPALSELAQKTGRTVLISHSQSGIYPFQTATINPQGIAAIISLEPGACPAADYDLKALKDIPVLVLFGDFVDKSEAWTNRYKGCEQFIKAARAAGVSAELVSLPDVGIHGNSHMMMQDRNSLQVAGWLVKWLRHHVRRTI